jgi:hypothetical protein
MSRLADEGLIKIKWHNPNVLIQYIELIDADTLAMQLGYTRRNDKLEKAKKRIEQALYADSHHFVQIREALFDKWKTNGIYEGFTVDEPVQLIDVINAADTLVSLGERTTEEMDERHFSTQVFSNSKKLKALKGKIAKLVKICDNEIPGDLTADEVFQLYGVVPIKHPIYVAGPVLIKSNDKTISADFPPCIGLWPSYVTSIINNGSVNTITSIENLATYIRYVEKERQDDELVLYTAGIPSPSFRGFYKLIADTFSAAKLRHWGDIDVGGFSILHILEKTVSRDILSYRMSTTDYENISSYGELSSSELNQLTNLSTKSNEVNKQVISMVIATGKKFEQESYFNAEANGNLSG